MYALVDDPAFDEISDWRLKVYFRFLADLPDKVDSGVYALESETTIDELLMQVLTKKPTSATLKLTILPGWNKYDIDEYLARSGIPGLLDRERELIELFSQKYSFLRGQDSFE